MGFSGLLAEATAFLGRQLSASATPDNRKRLHTAFPLAHIALLRWPAEPLPISVQSAKGGVHAPVAQLDRALPSEGKGHTFESCRVRQNINGVADAAFVRRRQSNNVSNQTKMRKRGIDLSQWEFPVGVKTICVINARRNQRIRTPIADRRRAIVFGEAAQEFGNPSACSKQRAAAGGATAYSRSVRWELPDSRLVLSCRPLF